MAALGEITAGVAHDINNLMQAIQGTLEVLRAQPDLDAEGRGCVAVLDSSAQLGATLARRLLACPREPVPEPALLQPGEVLAKLAGLLARALGSRVHVEAGADDAAWPVRADPAQLDLALLNLALNARDAMPGGGVVRLHVSNADSGAAPLAGLPAGEYVRFTVEDEGTGMSPETLARALEPFFTTKAVGRGTGLGLSMVRSFARQSGGDVRIESAFGQGTRVSVWLPRAAAPLPAIAQDQGGDGRECVLIVDDEAAIRWTLSRFLARAGFSPVAAESAEAALERLRAGEACDLLVTDESLPGMTGRELIAEATRLRPDLPSLLITGYAEVNGREQLRAGVAVLRKPFARAAFVHQVQASLGAARGALSG